MQIRKYFYYTSPTQILMIPCSFLLSLLGLALAYGFNDHLGILDGVIIAACCLSTLFWIGVALVSYQIAKFEQQNPYI